MTKSRNKDNKLENGDRCPRFTACKFSDNGNPNSNLFESVVIGGRPYFLFYNHNSEKLEIVEEVVDNFRILIPRRPNDYSYLPYAFKDIKEILDTLSDAKKENLYFLYERAISFVCKFMQV